MENNEEAKIQMGKRLRQLRKRKKKSQVEMAKEIGFSKAIISYWENGKREPTSGALITLSQYFDEPVDYLLGLVD